MSSWNYINSIINFEIRDSFPLRDVQRAGSFPLRDVQRAGHFVINESFIYNFK